MRGKTLELAFEHIANNPIFGIGLSDTVLYLDRPWAHNDHVGVLLQLGIVGYVVFIAFWISLWKYITKAPHDFMRSYPDYFIASKHMYITMFVLSFFIDVHTSSHFWFFIGLLIIPSKIAWSNSRKYVM